MRGDVRGTADRYIARSNIEGRGCFAAAHITRGRAVGELAGEADERTSIDATVGGDATAFINHSCDPNLFMRVHHDHLLFFALRNIAAGEELSLGYGQSHHDGARRCRCGSPRCRGAI